MFRRTPRSADVTPDPPVKPGGKGRPTPTRREAEAAARARAKAPRTRKEAAAAERAARSETRTRARRGMMDGDERYLQPRDKGPVRRFIRDYVDSRFQFIQIALPVMLLAVVLPYLGPSFVRFANVLLLTSWLLILYDIVTLRFRLRRELSRRFPGENPRGTTFYAVMRSLQLKFMRLPKPRVKIGEQLPEHYR